MEDLAEKVILFALCIVAWWMAFIVIAWAFIASIRAWTEVSEPIPAEKHPAVKMKRDAETVKRIRIMAEPEMYEVVDKRFVCTENDCGNGEVDWDVAYTERRE